VADAARKAAETTHDEGLKSKLETLEKAAESMKADNLDQARESMKKVSRAVVAIFEMYDTKVQGNYTIIECPMLKERWVQDTEEVRNPYFGAAMLSCGNLVVKVS
jgi:hypothetical protein